MNPKEEIRIDMTPDATQQIMFVAVKARARDEDSNGETHFTAEEFRDMVKFFHADIPAATVDVLSSKGMPIGFQTELIKGMEKPADVKLLLEEHRENLNYLAGLV